ncbi:hypothetical protein [Paractinoplanes durhamensis]|uniref:GNAT family N-acetyltransferase n=1 Tax=Paractinoplanes durhamensis TaxID=113563 RepID=A0ABQ3Z356_9ACTN|nr:hypothetical protein [Actinoplanes durhamensis]GIE04246.1 hypothetical protein Adu01nite_55960 [Actinoplanes durhamensis]
MSSWPTELRNALRVGRRLAVEVPGSGPGRRAFVDITPDRGDSPGFTVAHREYDAAMIDGFDYDIGEVLVRRARAADETQLLAVLREWELTPDRFDYAWNTADPR